MDYEMHFSVVPTNKKTELRPYRIDDIPLLVECVAKYVPELPSYKGIEVDREHLSYCLRHYKQNETFFQCWVLVDRNDFAVGGVAGFCTQGMLTRDIVTQDAFLFVLPNWRSYENVSKLIDVYNEWGKARNAVLIMASHVGGYEEKGMDFLLKRKGYKRVGSLYHLRRDHGFMTQQLEKLRGE